ncbi:MAG: preprotein translocase subunit YajC [Acidimicrobiia bacterium]|nr:preprotein translocase subunit YajC [Acidimicrobiia bacterium]MDQ3499857.1 preprotein translocase subunit YajC [Actinomycetota bacterium]
MIPLVFLTTSAPSAGSPIGSFLFLAVMLAVFYFLILRPQRRRMKAQQQLASSVEVGDRVQTIGGIQGRVFSVDDDTVIIDLEQGRIRLAKRAIAQKIDLQE